MDDEYTRPRAGTWVFLAAAALTLAALACGPIPTSVVVTATTAPEPAAPTEFPTLVLPTAVEEEPTAAPAAEVGELVVENLSQQTVCYLYVSPGDAEDWGEDQLGENELIDSGEAFSVFDIPVGTYDLRAADCDGETLVEQYGMKITSAGLTWTLSDTAVAEGITLTLVNNSSQIICYAYFSPTNSEDWGPDQLAPDQVIAIGEQVTFEGVSPGLYDLRVEACDTEDAVEDYGLDFSTDFEYTITD